MSVVSGDPVVAAPPSVIQPTDGSDTVDATKLNILFIVTACASMLGSLFVIRSYFRRKDLRTPSLKVVAIMAVCDFGFAAKFVGAGFYSLFGDQAKSATGTVLCELSGHAGQFFALSTVLWNGVVSLNLFFLLYKPRRHKPRLWTVQYHCVVWGYCILSAVVLAVKRQIGFTEDGTCWIMGKQSPYRLLFYVPLIASFIFATFAIVFATMRLRNRGKSNQLAATTRKVLSRKRASLIRIYMVTIVYVSVWSWSLIFRAVAFASDNPPPAWLVYIQAFFLGSQGFFNAAAWSLSVIFTPESKDRWRPTTRDARFTLADRRSRGDGMQPRSRMAPGYKIEEHDDDDCDDAENAEELPESLDVSSVYPSAGPPDHTGPDSVASMAAKDSVWRIAIRAAAGLGEMEYPSPTTRPETAATASSVSVVTSDKASKHSGSTRASSRRPHQRLPNPSHNSHQHGRNPSSFYDFYDMFVFESDSSYYSDSQDDEILDCDTLSQENFITKPDVAARHRAGADVKVPPVLPIGVVANEDETVPTLPWQAPPAWSARQHWGGAMEQH